MNQFQKIGPAVSRLGAAAVLAGGGGALVGDVRLFETDPGAGWLSENTIVSYDSEAAPHLANYKPGDRWDIKTTVGPAWNAVAYGGGIWVVVGSSGRIATSTDGGVSFTEIIAPQVEHLYAVAYGNGTFVVAGSNGAIMKSTDGVNWTSAKGGTASHTFRAVAYANGTWMLGGNTATIFRSADLSVDWIGVTASGVSYVYDFCYAADLGKWFACGGGGTYAIFSSTNNGQTWSSVTGIGTVPLPLWTIARANGVLLAGGADGKMYRSLDGVTWANQPYAFPSTTSIIRKIAHFNGYWMAVGSNGEVAVSEQLDATIWAAKPVLLSGTIQGLAYGNGLWVVGCNATYKIATTKEALGGFVIPSKPPGKEAFTAYTRIAA